MSVSADINAGLAGYWTMDGRDTNWSTNQMTDRSGNSNTGTLVNLSTSTSPIVGKVGQALKFNGSTSYISYPNTIAVGSNDFSVSAWIRRDGVVDATQGGVAFTQRYSATGPGIPGITLLVAGTTNYPQFSVRDSIGSGVNAVSSTATNVGQWYHMVGVKVAGFIYLYVDGVLVATTAHSMTGDFSGSVDVRNIGKTRFDDLNWSYFPGIIDEVRFYTRALSAQDVKQLYNQGKVKMSSNNAVRPTSDTLSQGLVGYWTMDGKDINWNANTITDKSGNGNTGTMTNMSTTTSPVLGKVGQALKFDGTDDYISIPYTNLNYERTQPFSVSAWINFNDVAPAGGSQSVFGRAAVSGQKGLFFARCKTAQALYCNANAFAIAILSNSNTSGIGMSTATGSFPPNVLTHVVLTYDGSSNASGVSVYKNGVSQSLTTYYNNLTTSMTQNVNWHIGDDTTSDYASGPIDDVRLYNRVLAQQEITQLYKQGQAKIASSPSIKPIPDALSKGLTAYWTMDGKDINWNTNTIIDKSGNGNTGSLTSMSTTTSPALGALGQSLNFGRISNDYMYTAGDLLGPGDKTFCVWVNPERLSSGSGYIVYTPSSSFMARLNSSNVIIVSSNSITTTLSGSTIASNVWSHICVVRQSSGNATIYVNNTSVASGSTGTPDAEIAGLYVGNLSAANRVFPGKMDELRIYNRLLSTKEISQLYKLGLSKHR